MDFFDFSKEARIKEEARIKALENNVINKATKMALDKFSKVYGGTTQVIAKTANLREFKRNYLSGKIASELCISTKQGTKNIPFTILIKASEPSILESDQIICEKVASTEGSLDAEINSIISKQEQKLANLEAEEQNNKRILADLAKGVSIEAARKAHIFKEAKKQNKQERNSLSTATTPTDFLGDVVEYFTYPKTFFPAMKVGAVVDIAGVKYKYIGDEATMTEPAGNTNGTIARFELANKKKASLNKEAAVAEGEEPWFVHTEDKEKILVYGPNGSFDYVVFTDDRFQSDDKEITDTFLFPQAVAEELAYKHQGWADPWFGPGPKGAAVALASTKENIEVKADEEVPEIELTDEILDTPVKQQVNPSAQKIFLQMGKELGYAGRGVYIIYQKWKGDKDTVTFRDIYEEAKRRAERHQAVSSGEEKKGRGRQLGSKNEKLTPEQEEEEKIFSQEDNFFSNDEKVLDAIGDAENIEDAGYKLKNGEDLNFLKKRYEVNLKLSDNRVNDILVDIVAEDPHKAFDALQFIFPDDPMGDKTADDSSIAEKYKKILFESAAQYKDIPKLKKMFPFIDKYVAVESSEDTIKDYNPILDEEFDDSAVIAFLNRRPRPTKEELKAYVDKYNVLEEIDKEIEKYQQIINSLEESKDMEDK